MEITRNGIKYNIPVDYIIKVMLHRFHETPDFWHSEAKDSLFMEYLKNVEYFGYVDGDPEACVDNFLINADIIERTDESDDDWNNVVSIVKNDKYACVRFK